MRKCLKEWDVKIEEKMNANAEYGAIDTVNAMRK